MEILRHVEPIEIEIHLSGVRINSPGTTPAGPHSSAPEVNLWSPVYTPVLIF